MKGKEGAEMHPGGLQTLLDVSIYVEKLFFIYYIGFVVVFFLDSDTHGFFFFLNLNRPTKMEIIHFFY